uniref:Uncharacterized protein n=1 Tax=Fagus sylvatica TaxID=28930 RepID=A0A2N9IAA9_FAGSY
MRPPWSHDLCGITTSAAHGLSLSVSRPHRLTTSTGHY